MSAPEGYIEVKEVIRDRCIGCVFWNSEKKNPQVSCIDVIRCEGVIFKKKEVNED